MATALISHTRELPPFPLTVSCPLGVNPKRIARVLLTQKVCQWLRENKYHIENAEICQVTLSVQSFARLVKAHSGGAASATWNWDCRVSSIWISYVKVCCVEHHVRQPLVIRNWSPV